MKELEKWVEKKVKEEQQLEYIIDVFTEFYGVDPAYYGVDTYSLAKHLVEKGIAFPVRCKDCKQGEIDDPDFPNQYYCHEGCGWNDAKFFCSYGERKESL